jgi:3D (Asp-Asp-Asp) domain-containing protein
MEATAYCYTGHKTKIGTWPKEERTVAVDPKVIPYGSRMVINGVGGYIAEDCGGAIKGRIIDIYMDSNGECVSWGRRTVEVRIVE